MPKNIMNKKATIVNIFHFILLLMSWLTISPLFYFLGRRWKSFKKGRGITLLLISPLFLVLYLFLTVWGSSEYYDYRRENRFADQKVLSRITEAPFPSFTKKQYIKGRTSFTGDYMDELLIEFKETPSDDFYQIIDSLINVPNSDWHRSNDGYWYSKIWGNDFPAPKGEDDEEDMTICIWITKGNKEAMIRYGAW